MSSPKKKRHILAIIPDLDGEYLLLAVESLLAQDVPVDVLVVDNGVNGDSIASLAYVKQDVHVMHLDKNYGFAGGVNRGITYAIEHGYPYVLLFNNDARCEKDFSAHLYSTLEANPELGMATGKLLTESGEVLDSTGEGYSTWGLPFPRGRGEKDLDAYDNQVEVLSVSGGASMYRTKMLEDIGLFDEDFFAYYEDVDLGLRAQLAGWRAAFVPASVAYHRIGNTSAKWRGFTSYQTFKNLPWLHLKNMPGTLYWRSLPKLLFAYIILLLSALAKGMVLAVIRGVVMTLVRLPKKIGERHRIQRFRKLTPQEFEQRLEPHIPRSYVRLRQLANFIGLK